jgi:hypothetical protein
LNVYNSIDNLHCELAAIKKESKNTSLEKVISNLSINAKNKDFTISKFCCYLCHLAFESLAEAYNEINYSNESDLLSKKCLINFYYLGNSCTIYPTYKNISVEETDFSLLVAAKLKEKVEEIIAMVEKDKYKLCDQAENFIENTELIKFCFIEENAEIILF